MEWSEPVLLRYDFEAGPMRSPALVRLGFPKPVDERNWICAFQFQGVGRDDDRLNDGPLYDDQLKNDCVYRLMGSSGLEAVVEASNAIRSRFEELPDIHASKAPYEFVFPRFLPTSSWFDLYDWAKELVELQVSQAATTGGPASPAVEALSRTTWDEPTLLNRQFKFVGGRKIIVRVGFPAFSQEREAWACTFQLRSAATGIRKAYGQNGLLALANVADAIRTSLHQIGARSSDNDGYQLTFSAHIPTNCGLEVHRHLCERITAEIKNVEQQDDDRAYERAKQFEELLTKLPRARGCDGRGLTK